MHRNRSYAKKNAKKIKEKQNAAEPLLHLQTLGIIILNPCASSPAALVEINDNRTKTGGNAAGPTLGSLARRLGRKFNGRKFKESLPRNHSIEDAIFLLKT